MGRPKQRPRHPSLSVKLLLSSSRSHPCLTDATEAPRHRDPYPSPAARLRYSRCCAILGTPRCTRRDKVEWSAWRCGRVGGPESLRVFGSHRRTDCGRDSEVGDIWNYSIAMAFGGLEDGQPIPLVNTLSYHCICFSITTLMSLMLSYGVLVIQRSRVRCPC